MKSSPEPTRRSASFPSSLDGTTLVFLSLLFGLFVIYFGVLLATVFELYRFLDVLYRSPGDWLGGPAMRIVVLIVVFALLIRVAWRLSFSIIGLLTPKYDSIPEAGDTLLVPREANAVLYELAAEVCHRLNAPMPDEIRLAPQAACYVIEERKFSFQTVRRLKLVLGLPQMLGLTVAELEPILAHELAHFRRGHTTQIVFLYRFAESLRLAIAAARRRWWRWIDPVHWLCVAIHRLFVACSAPVQRRQELRADAVSASVAGSDRAIHTLLKDWRLENEFDAAVEQFLDSQDGKAAQRRGSVYQVFLDRWREFSAESEEYLAQRLAEEEQGRFFDPLPTIRSRVEIIRRFPPNDRPADNRPASRLLDDVAGYEFELHRRLFPETLAPRPTDASNDERPDKATDPK